MKKITFLLVFALFIAQNGIAQPGLIWEKQFGGSRYEGGGNALQTSDGNWVFAASASSSDGDVPQNQGELDLWVVKMDTTGAIIWSKTFGGSNFEYGGNIAECPDGSLWVAGQTFSEDGIFSANKGKDDVCLLKISSAGDLIFAKTYGGTGSDPGADFAPTADGGLVFVSATWSASGSGDVVFNHGERDCWLVKVGASGQIEWQKSIGGSQNELICSIEKSKFGGFWVSVRSESGDGDFPVLTGADNTWVLRLAENGSVVWKQRIAEANNFVFPAIQEDAAGNLVLMMGFASDWRTYLIKFDQNGNKTLQKAITEPYPPDYFSGFELADDSGIFFFGNDTLLDGLLVRANADGDFLWKKTFGTDAGTGGYFWKVLPRADNSLVLFGGIVPDTLAFVDVNADAHVWVLKLGETVSVGSFAEKTAFGISPNPISDGEPLQILLENDFLGKVKIELFTLDGRLVSVFENEKMARKHVFEIEKLPAQSQFIVRVSDEKKTAARLVFKF